MEMDRILSCIFEFAFVICWLHLLTLQLSPGAPGTIWTAASSTSLQASVSSSPTLNQNKSFCLSCLSLSEGLGLFPLFFCAAARQANNKKTNIALILSKSTQSKVQSATLLQRQVSGSDWARWAISQVIAVTTTKQSESQLVLKSQAQYLNCWSVDDFQL